MKVFRRAIPLRRTGQTRTFLAKQGWRVIGGRRIYMRSLWEVRVAKYFQFLKEQRQIKEWEYEPQTFWFEKIKRGTRSYLPDFKITRLDDTHYWVEVKGYMDQKSLTKIKRFKKYYPEEKLLVLEKEWYARNIVI